ncbi:MAG: alkaline phosphatase D family protein [Opitutales bacterium]
MNNKFLKAVLVLIIAIQFSFAAEKNSTDTQFKIAFGSCGKQDHPLPVFKEVIKQKPNLFIFLGDNIYGDTHDMELLRNKYKQLGSKESYQHLIKNTEVLATWDDHDYGQNDSGKEYPHKEASKKIFLDFFKEPKNSERYKHKGIYHSVYKKAGDKIIQIILLDNRTFRDDLIRFPKGQKVPSRFFYRPQYLPHTDDFQTFLGEEQWTWLENELRKNADLRIIASGSQFSHEYNGYESWTNFPHEQERLIQLIKKTKAEHLLFISGDVHYAEVSKFEHSDCYPIYDITSSGLSSTWRFATPNKNRLEGPIMENHFGLLTVDFDQEAPKVKAEIWDVRGNQRVDYDIPLSEISFD